MCERRTNEENTVATRSLLLCTLTRSDQGGRRCSKTELPLLYVLHRTRVRLRVHHAGRASAVSVFQEERHHTVQNDVLRRSNDV